MAQPEKKDQKASTSKRRGRFRRFLRWTWRALLVYCLLSVIVSFIPEGPLEIDEIGPGERIVLSGDLYAGAAKIDITPGEDLRGQLRLYGEEPPIEGVHDPIYARALSLGTAKSDDILTFVSVEILIIPPTLRPAVKAELADRGHPGVHLVLGATHTHAGPGNFWTVPFADYYMGELNETFFGDLVDGIAAAVVKSIESMRRARIGFVEAQTQHLVKHRRLKEPVTGLRPPVDEELEVMRVDAKDGSATIAYVLNFGAHPTTILHRTDRQISGGFPGAISRKLEERQKGAVALFMQGACGSVRATSPRPYANYAGIAHEKFAKVEMQADMLLHYVTQAEANIRYVSQLDLSAALIRVALPGPDAHFFPEERPYMVVRVLTLIPNWLFNRLADWWALPDETVFQAVRINNAYLLTFPCDLSNRLGWEIKRHIRRDHVFILGHSNDYAMGYVLTREEYDMGGIRKGGSERGQCYFGKRAGPFCVKVAHELASRVREADADDVFRYRTGGQPGRLPDGTRLK